MSILKPLSELNPWGTNAFEVTGLRRNFYLNKILPFNNSNLIRVLSGQRRCGKSHLLRSMIHHFLHHDNLPSKNILYLNMELRECLSLSDSESIFNLVDAYKKELKPVGKWYLFIDEVQEITNWERVLNALLMNPNDEVGIFISGSNAELLSGELATCIGGRYVSFELLPFSYPEFLEIEKKPAGLESFSYYLYHGGLPECFHLPDEERRSHYVRNLFDSIVFRDVIKRHNVRDVWMLEKLALLLADTIGGLFSQRKLFNTINSLGGKTNLETLGNYLSYLKQAFYVYDVPRYDIRGRNILGGERKYYLNDPAFRFYMNSSFDNNPGKYLENAVYLHLRRLGYEIRVGRVSSALDDGEIDFVASKADQTIYVQVCYLLSDERVIEREFGNLEKVNDNYPKFVVSLDPVSFGNRRGIRHMRAWEFLQDENAPCAKLH